MALRNFVSLQHDDEQLYDLSKGMPDDYEPPEYPSGCCFSLAEADLEKAGAGDPAVGASMRFSAMCTVTSVYSHIKNGCRIEMEMQQFAGEDGKFFDPTFPAHLCLCDAEMEKMDLDPEAEVGDLLHLIGNARVDAVSSTQWGGDMVQFQITDLTFEDESDESREG